MINFIKIGKQTAGLVLCIASCILLYTFQEVYAAPQWQVALNVGTENASNRLVLGADDTATEGFDNVWESMALLGGMVKSYFPHPEWKVRHDAFQRDIRKLASGTTKEWRFIVDSSLTNERININWDLTQIPDDYDIQLIDDTTGSQTDMRLSPSYDFIYTDVRSLRVAVTTTDPKVIPHKYDTDQDWKIGDFELLAVIDDWAAGNLDDFGLLSMIDFWAKGCYHWDADTKTYKLGC